MQDWGTLLDEIVTYLNAQSFSKSILFSRSYLPKNTVTNLATLSGVVFPSTETRERLNRQSFKVTRVIGVAFSIKIDADNSETGPDDYIDVVQEALTLLQDLKYDTGDVTSIVQNDPVYDYDKFAETSVFQSLLLITVEGYRDA